MDYSLAALKLLCVQLKSAIQTPSQNSFTRRHSLPTRLVTGIYVCVRVFVYIHGDKPLTKELQGILVSAPCSSDGGGNGEFLLDDGTGVIELILSSDFRSRRWEAGMYVMVVGGYFDRAGDLPMIKVHKMVDLSPFPDRESMWYLEVMEAFKLFYQPLFEE
ncbi:UNVERIFIED_CONTAM: hypothetical protein Sradi_1241300 [Sesamum radiatum]|uniref:RecQ-mediated genome instability protein 2 n=1 Tax=Sesamum radiatum TaxID=300843 RepID=A0AAW2UNZ2_SESRA